MEYIHVVTVMIEYELYQQFAFVDEADAKEKETELSKMYFEDRFEEAFNDVEGDEPAYPEFEKDATFMDYQGSSAWWDDDSRVTVFNTMIAVSGSSKENK